MIKKILNYLRARANIKRTSCKYHKEHNWILCVLSNIIGLANNLRIARNVIISFIIFNKNILNLFNLDIGSILSYFF